MDDKIELEWFCIKCKVLCVSDKAVERGQVYVDACWRCGIPYSFLIGSDGAAHVPQVRVRQQDAWTLLKGAADKQITELMTIE